MAPGNLPGDKCLQVALAYDFLLGEIANPHPALQARKDSPAHWYWVKGTCLDERSVDEGLRIEA